jgi:hypothetical protein
MMHDLWQAAVAMQAENPYLKAKFCSLQAQQHTIGAAHTVWW